MRKRPMMAETKKPTPYYEDSAVTIYHGDCREILPTLGKIADLVVTDPPYGVDYDGGTTVREKLTGDKTPNLYGETLPLVKKVAKDESAFYLFYADGDQAVLQAVLQAGLKVRNNLIWNKQMAQFGALSAQYKQKHEPFLYCHVKGKSPKWRGPTNEVTVWDIDRASSNGLHPTQKPVNLFLRCIRNSSDVGDVVLDPFLGSGSSLRAAKDIGRKGIGIEINEAYAEVAAKRMAQEVLQFA